MTLSAFPFRFLFTEQTQKQWVDRVAMSYIKEKILKMYKNRFNPRNANLNYNITLVLDQNFYLAVRQIST